MRTREREPHRVAPCPFVASMVQFVEDDERIVGNSLQHICGVSGSHLLEGGDDAMHVFGNAAAGSPIGIELQPETVRRQAPLHLQVAGWGNHHHPPALLRQGPAGAREGKGGLAGAGGCDRQKVRFVVAERTERIERSALPRAKANGCHRRGRRAVIESASLSAMAHRYNAAGDSGVCLMSDRCTLGRVGHG